jgi:hypothetical protein
MVSATQLVECALHNKTNTNNLPEGCLSIIKRPWGSEELIENTSVARYPRLKADSPTPIMLVGGGHKK